MKKMILVMIAAALQLVSNEIIAQQTGGYFTTQGQRYNLNEPGQGFIYDLKVDSGNMIIGTVIQENSSELKNWCGHLKVTAWDKEKKPMATFTTAQHNLEAKGKANSSITFTEQVKWVITDAANCQELEIEAVDDKCK
jgi:hypothetical protein